MWDTWFARLPTGILKMPDLTLKYFEYLRPAFSLKSLLGLLIIKEEKGTSESKERYKAARLFSGLEKVEQINPASCSESTALFRATWSLWAANPRVTRHLNSNLHQPCSSSSFFISLDDSFMIRIAAFLDLGGLSLVHPILQWLPIKWSPPFFFYTNTTRLCVNEVHMFWILTTKGLILTLLFG